MTPEVWVTITTDWRESLPAVINGTDDKFYPDGWATDNKAPRTLRTSLEYICFQKHWPIAEIRGRRTSNNLTDRRDACAMALQRRHSNKNMSQLAKAMNRDHSSMTTMLKRARYKEKTDSEFRDLVASLESLV